VPSIGVLIVLLEVLRVVGGVCRRGAPRRGMEHGVWCEVMLGFACSVFECPRMYDMCVMGAGCEAALGSVILVLVPLVGGAKEI
jgi:hypothetical protein